MSSAASTIPGRRASYNSARGYRPANVLQKTNKSGRKSPVVKEESNDDNIHKQWGKGDGYAYLFTGADEDKSRMKKIAEDEEVSIPSTTEPTARRGNKTVKTRDIIHDIHKGARKKRESYNRFMNNERAPPDNIVKETVVSNVNTTANKGILITSTKKYDELMQERIQLYAQHNTFKKQIKRLEDENKQLLDNFNSLYEENKRLRSKMETEDTEQPIIEPYKRVFDDRKILRQAEDNYKQRIKRLEQDVKDLQKINTDVLAEMKDAKANSLKMREQLTIQAKASNLQWELKTVRNENKLLKKNIDILNKKFNEIPPDRSQLKTVSNNNLPLIKAEQKLKSGYISPSRLVKSQSTPLKIDKQKQVYRPKTIDFKPVKRLDYIEMESALPKEREPFDYEKTLADSYYE